MTPRSVKNRYVFLLSIIPLALLVALFWRALTPGAQFAQRDESFYYYPLFELVQHNWSRGVLPLWNPYDNLGQPLAGDPTASVFYPGKVVFALVSLGLVSFAACFKIYIIGHVALAYATARTLAKRLGVSHAGATLSGISYAFAGQTLFQYSNVIYLVGAAWAPALALYSFQFHFAATSAKKRQALVLFSLCSSMTILGGEPQVVYLAFLLNLLAIFFQRRKGSTFLASLKTKSRSGAAFLFASALLTFLLSAVQILPSLELTERSTRAQAAQTRSLWTSAYLYGKARLSSEDVPFTREEFFDGVLCRDFAQGGKDASIYRFSVGPWRWFEFLFPNIGGRQFPQNERWFEVVPDELSVWTPSLYFGIFPCVLALSAARRRNKANSQNASRETRRETRREKCQIVATYLVVFGLIGSLGGYGLAWFLRVICSTLRDEPLSLSLSSGDPIGGLYWFLNLFAPKFAQFRYPAKLIVVAAIGFSLLAGFGWDQRFSGKTKRIALAALAISALGFVVSYVGTTLSPIWTKAFHIPPNPLFGPFQPEAAAKCVVLSFGRAFLFLFASLVLASVAKGQIKAPRWGRLLDIVSLIIIAADIYVASSWIVTTAPTKLFAKRSQIEKQIADNVAQKILANENVDVRKLARDALPPTRVYRYPVWFPPFFQTESSPRRLEERVLWDGETLFPKRGLSRNIALIDSRGAAMDAEFSKFLDYAYNGNDIDAQLAFLGVSAVVGPKFWTDRIVPSSKSTSDSQATSDWRLDLKLIDSNTTRAALIYDAQQSENLLKNDNSEPDEDQVKLLAYEANKRLHMISARRDGSVLLAEQFWPDWEARLIPLNRQETRALANSAFQTDNVDNILQNKGVETTVKIEPEFGFLQKISIPQGRWLLVTEYKPRKIYYGALVSLGSWSTLIGFVFIQRARRNGRRRVGKLR